MSRSKILTLDDFTRGGSPVNELLSRAWPFWEEAARPITEVARGVTAYAEVNHGRWIVNCPIRGCLGAAMASRHEHVFFCLSCLHTGDPRAAYKWIPVVWPTDAEEIEHVLLARPDERTRNWRVGESLRELYLENASFVGDSALGALVTHLMEGP